MEEPAPKFEAGDRVVLRESILSFIDVPMQAFRVLGRTFRQTYEGSDLRTQGWLYFLLNEHTSLVESSLFEEELLQKAPSQAWDKEEV